MSKKNQTQTAKVVDPTLDPKALEARAAELNVDISRLITAGLVEDAKVLLDTKQAQVDAESAARKSGRSNNRYDLFNRKIATRIKEGKLPTGTEDREIDVVFPSPLPENMTEKLKEAQIKKELGVPTEQVLRELGYESS